MFFNVKNSSLIHDKHHDGNFFKNFRDHLSNLLFHIKEQHLKAYQYSTAASQTLSPKRIKFKSLKTIVDLKAQK